MDYVQLLAAHDQLIEENGKLQKQIKDLRDSGRSIIEHEMRRTREALELRDQNAKAQAALKLAYEALLHSSPHQSHYPEPEQRHVAAVKAVRDVMPLSAA